MLNDEQYFELCNLCDSLLNRKKTIYRIAIPWLHVLKWHPSLLQDYITCFNEKKIQFHFTYNVNKLLIHILGWLVSLYRSCFLIYQEFQYLSKPKAEYDISATALVSYLLH